MTQNVKSGRGFTPTIRAIRAGLALIWLSLAGVTLASGCASDGPKQTPGCAGSNCASSGRFTSCRESRQCDEAHGFSCVDGECNYECQSHADCVEVGHCDTRDVAGERKRYCVHDAAPPSPGGLYTSCPKGDECGEPALCIGAGEGDLDAYCTIDCADDDDCAAGYFCGSVVRAPCEDACDFAGQPTDARCAPADQIGSGGPYRCGLNGPERRVCRQRDFCAACSSDADCLGQPNQVCARDASGEKICTRLCDAATRSCPWGNATECAIFDADLGVATCSHRFGSCHGTGQTCEPCRSNDDCPSGVCWGSQFTGERWCIDFDTKCECRGGVTASGTCANGGCPDSPSGLPLECIGPGDSQLSDTCYAANSATETLLGSSPQTGCWGPL